MHNFPDRKLKYKAWRHRIDKLESVGEIHGRAKDLVEGVKMGQEILRKSEESGG